MSNIASINFKKTKADFQVWHNDRTLAPEYLISQKNVQLNRTGLEANALRDKIIVNAQSAYFKRLNQRCQAKNYLWSAALNIKETTTMSELENLARHFKDKYGIQCYQIAIHKDEGHKNAKGEIVLNNHAHMEFVTLDESGINRQRDFGKFIDGKKVLSYIQDDVARLLKMERGISVKKSKARRIEPRAWAKIKEKEMREKMRLNEYYRQILANEQKARQDEILEFQNKIKALNEKQNLSDNELKKIKLEGQNNAIRYLIKKFDEIRKSDNEIFAFMDKNDENNKLLSELYKNIKALIRVYTRTKLSAKESDYQDALQEIGRLKYDLENSKPNEEYKKHIKMLLKRYNYKKIAKTMGYELYSDNEINNFDDWELLGLLAKSLEFLHSSYLDLAQDFSTLANMWNEKNDEKIFDIFSAKTTQVMNEINENNTESKIQPIKK